MDRDLACPFLVGGIRLRRGILAAIVLGSRLGTVRGAVVVDVAVDVEFDRAGHGLAMFFIGGAAQLRSEIRGGWHGIAPCRVRLVGNGRGCVVGLKPDGLGVVRLASRRGLRDVIDERDIRGVVVHFGGKFRIGSKLRNGFHRGIRDIVGERDILGLADRLGRERRSGFCLEVRDVVFGRGIRGLAVRFGQEHRGGVCRRVRNIIGERDILGLAVHFDRKRRRGFRRGIVLGCSFRTLDGLADFGRLWVMEGRLRDEGLLRRWGGFGLGEGDFGVGWRIPRGGWQLDADEFPFARPDPGDAQLVLSGLRAGFRAPAGAGSPGRARGVDLRTIRRREGGWPEYCAVLGHDGLRRGAGRILGGVRAEGGTSGKVGRPPARRPLGDEQHPGQEEPVGHHQRPPREGDAPRGERDERDQAWQADPVREAAAEATSDACRNWADSERTMTVVHPHNLPSTTRL